MLENGKQIKNTLQGKLQSGRLSHLSGTDCHLGILLPRATPVLTAPNLTYELSNRLVFILPLKYVKMC